THLPKAFFLLPLVPYLSWKASLSAFRSSRQSLAALLFAALRSAFDSRALAETHLPKFPHSALNASRVAESVPRSALHSLLASRLSALLGLAIAVPAGTARATSAMATIRTRFMPLPTHVGRRSWRVMPELRSR